MDNKGKRICFGGLFDGVAAGFCTCGRQRKLFAEIENYRETV